MKCCFGWLYVWFDGGEGKDIFFSFLTGPLCCGCYEVFFWKSKAEKDENAQSRIGDKKLTFSHGPGGNWDEKNEEEDNGGKSKERKSNSIDKDVEMVGNPISVKDDADKGNNSIEIEMVGDPISVKDDADRGKWLGKHSW